MYSTTFVPTVHNWIHLRLRPSCLPTACIDTTKVNSRATSSWVHTAWLATSLSNSCIIQTCRHNHQLEALAECYRPHSFHLLPSLEALFKYPTNGYVALTSGKHKADRSRLENPSPTSIKPNQHRETSIATLASCLTSSDGKPCTCAQRAQSLPNLANQCLSWSIRLDRTLTLSERYRIDGNHLVFYWILFWHQCSEMYHFLINSITCYLDHFILLVANKQ